MFAPGRFLDLDALDPNSYFDGPKNEVRETDGIVGLDSNMPGVETLVSNVVAESPEVDNGE